MLKLVNSSFFIVRYNQKFFGIYIMFNFPYCDFENVHQIDFFIKKYSFFPKSFFFYKKLGHDSNRLIFLDDSYEKLFSTCN